MKSKVSIVILNWNGWKDTIECLESLYRIDYPNYEVFVIDNASDNNSCAKIKSWLIWNLSVDSEKFQSCTSSHDINFLECSKNDIFKKKYTKEKSILNLKKWKKLILLKNDQNNWFAWWNNIVIQQILREKESDFTLLLNNDTTVESDFLSLLVEKIMSQSNIWSVGPKFSIIILEL